MGMEELSAVERARQVHYSMFQIASDNYADGYLGPGQMLNIAHNLFDVIVPAYEIGPLDLAYFALIRRMRNPVVMANLDELLEDEELIEEVLNGLNILEPDDFDTFVAWKASKRIARHPIDMEELEAVKLAREEHIRRFMNDDPPIPS